MELVTDVEEEGVFLLRPQVIYRGLDTRVSAIASKSQVGAVVAGGSEAVQMGMNVIDVEDSNIEGIVTPASITVVVAATFGLECVYLCAVFANDYGGEGGDQEKGWKNEGYEPHGEPAKAEGRSQTKKKTYQGDIYLEVEDAHQLDHMETQARVSAELMPSTDWIPSIVIAVSPQNAENHPSRTVYA